jgi:hypothetical protein
LPSSRNRKVPFARFPEGNSREQLQVKDIIKKMETGFEQRLQVFNQQLL